jgi:hypothetical protein
LINSPVEQLGCKRVRLQGGLALVNAYFRNHVDLWPRGFTLAMIRGIMWFQAFASKPSGALRVEQLNHRLGHTQGRPTRGAQPLLARVLHDGKARIVCG